MKPEEEEIYRKVASTLKIKGCGDLCRVTISSFKGTDDCEERLKQLSNHLDWPKDECSFGISMHYNKHGNIYSATISGYPCEIELPGGDVYWNFDDLDSTAESICGEHNLDKEEVMLFLKAVPEKDDFWGWLYRCGCHYEPYFQWEDVFAALIAPACKGTIVLTLEERHYITAEIWDPTWADGKGGWDLVEDGEEDEED